MEGRTRVARLEQVGAAPAHARSAAPPLGRAIGFTLLEFLVVLAVVGTVAAGGLALARPGGAVRAAHGARAFLLWARLEAMWTGDAVAVVPSVGPALVARRGDAGDAPAACLGPEVKRFELARYGRARVLQALRSGIVWLPEGGARSCGGGGVISGRMVLADGARRVAVVVSSLGRVRVEVTR